MKLSQLPSPLKYFFSSSKPTGRSLQLRLDAAKLYTLLQSSTYAYRSSFIQNKEEDHEGSEEDMYIANQLGIESLPSIEYQASIIKYHFLSSTKEILEQTYNSYMSSNDKSIQQNLKHRFSYVPIIDKSSISNAGRGLYIDGKVEGGNIIGIYPGASYYPSQLRKFQTEKENNTDVNQDEQPQQVDLSDYMIARYDGIIIDGSSNIEIDLSTIEDIEQVDTEVIENNIKKSHSNHHPFANAHLVNHPIHSEHVNVLQFMIDIDSFNLNPNLIPLIPIKRCEVPISRLEQYENTTAKQRVKDSSHFTLSHIPNERLMKTIVLVALRDIENEELFMDYRFNPKVPHPEWYVPCDKGENASRRWFPRGVFY